VIKITHEVSFNVYKSYIALHGTTVNDRSWMSLWRDKKLVYHITLWMYMILSRITSKTRSFDRYYVTYIHNILSRNICNDNIRRLKVRNNKYTNIVLQTGSCCE